jgi:hypothetical protein
MIELLSFSTSFSLPSFATPLNTHQARVAFPGQNREDVVDWLQMQEGSEIVAWMKNPTGDHLPRLIEL